MCKKGVCVCVCVYACEKERERNKDEIGTPNAIDTFLNYTCAINGIRSRFHISLHTYTTSNFCIDFFFAFFFILAAFVPTEKRFFFLCGTLSIHIWQMREMTDSDQLAGWMVGVRSIHNKHIHIAAVMKCSANQKYIKVPTSFTRTNVDSGNNNNKRH